jgi:hypothetical protein
VESGVRAFEWMSPPGEWLGRTVLLDLEVAASEDVVIVLTHLVAYPIGFSLGFQALARRPPGEVVGEFDGDLALRFGVEFSDGRAAEGKTWWIRREHEDDEPPTFPARMPPDRELELFVNPGGSSPRELRFAGGCWVWPLPPPGPLKLSVGWPAARLAAPAVELEAEPILVAAAAVEPIWEDG